MQPTSRRRPALVLALVLAAGGLVASAGRSSADVTSVRGSACGYYVNVGLFGGPQQLRGCGQAGDAPALGTSPSVTLPATGSSTPITASDPDGAIAQYGPARIFAGRWPEHVASAPPSGPISVSTQGTTGAGGTVTSSVDIVLRTPADADSPGGFGPGPVEGDELHTTCSATESGVTGSTRFVNALLTTATDAGGSPLTTEPIPDNPPPNYTRHGVITNVGDVFSVVFNEQIANPDGSLTVNAFHMYLFGPVAIGESVGGQVTCGTSPSSAPPTDTQRPICGVKVVAPIGPDDPTPRSPREELIGVADAGGLQTISNVQVTNGTVNVPPNGTSYLEFNPGQKGPLPIKAVRTPEAEAANLTMTWSFDATDAAGNTSHCDGTGSPATQTTTPTSTSTTPTTTGSGATTTTGSGATTTTTVAGATTTTLGSGTTTTVAGGGAGGGLGSGSGSPAPAGSGSPSPSTSTAAANNPAGGGTPTTLESQAGGGTITVAGGSAPTPTSSSGGAVAVLARTGSRVLGLLVVSAVALVFGSLLLASRVRRPAAEAGRTASVAPDAWGPKEIMRALTGLAGDLLARFTKRSR